MNISFSALNYSILYTCIQQLVWPWNNNQPTDERTKKDQNWMRSPSRSLKCVQIRLQATKVNERDGKAKGDREREGARKKIGEREQPNNTKLYAYVYVCVWLINLNGARLLVRFIHANIVFFVISIQHSLHIIFIIFACLYISKG